MSWVKAKPGESIESLLRRFKKEVENSGVLADLRKNERYEKPSVARKRKHEEHIKKENRAKKKQKIKPKQLNWQWNKDRTKKIIQRPSSSRFNKVKRINNRTSYKGKSR